jgi:cyclopropane fatty-acyl-phospholipid synthase-like methyltransferase
MNKSFSQSCENNKDPILQVIKTVYLEPTTVWEIGSGTGQHACHFANHLSHLTWQPTDRKENLKGIDCWVEEAGLINLKKALALNVTDKEWPCQSIDAVFTANTLHIMHWPEVECFFSRLANYLSEKATVCIYGPFNYNGQYTSDSNQQFDRWLTDRDPQSGIRDFEAIEQLAKSANLKLENDFPMPANNRLLVFKKA